jgi:acetyl esterase/lipase
MKAKYIFLVLGLLTVATFGFIFENVFSIWEQASYTRFRPVTTGLPSAQIVRDLAVGGVTADIFNVPYVEGQPKRPLLVVVHGGFLQGGNKKNYAYMGGLGVRHGYVVAIVQLPHYPGIFTRPFYSADALRARSLPAQAKQFAEFLNNIKQFGSMVLTATACMFSPTVRVRCFWAMRMSQSSKA